MGDLGSIPGSGRSPGEGNGNPLTHSSILAWRIPQTEKPGRLLHGVAKSRTWLSFFTFTFHFHSVHKHLLGIYSMPGCAVAAEPLSLLSSKECGNEKDGSRPLTVNSVGRLQQNGDIWDLKGGRKRKTTRMGLDQIKVSVWFSSVVQLCPTLCDPMDCSTPGLPVHLQLPESTQSHVHRVNDVIQPSHPLSSPSPLALNLSQHQGLFKWVSSSH